MKGNLAIVRKGVTPSDVYRSPVLEDMSVAAFQNDPDAEEFQQLGFIAREWFPTIPEADQQVKYYEIDMDTIAQNKAKPRAPGATAEEGTWNATLKTVLCEQYGYREKMPEELSSTMSEADETSAMSVAEVLAISDEVRCAAKGWTTGVWGADIAGGGSISTNQVVYWNNASGVPITDILTQRSAGKLRGKRRYNTAVLGIDVATALLTNPQIIARVVNGQKPGASAQATLDDLAALFKVQRVLVAEAVYNTANEGATATPSYIFNSKCAWLGYVNPKPGKLKASAGYRFAWQGISGNPEGLRNWKYWNQDARSMWNEGAVDDTFQIVSKNCGTFFNGIVQ